MTLFRGLWAAAAVSMVALGASSAARADLFIYCTDTANDCSGDLASVNGNNKAIYALDQTFGGFDWNP